MKLQRWIRTTLFGLIKKVAHSDFLQSLIWGRNAAQSLMPLDSFTDSKGNSFQRLKGWRESVVPRCTKVFDPQPNTPVVKTDQIIDAKNAVAAMENFIRIHGYSIKGKKVLEVGCHGGAHAYAMVELGTEHVDGIDIPQYGVRQSQGKKENRETIEGQSEWLSQLREATARLYEKKWACQVRDKVDFFDLDIADLDKDKAYDAIISWQTLEHITHPRRAIENMFRALQPGGIGFHAYNPYFCINGGHSLCTLDFPYGHARLANTDFENYIKTYRPQELEVARNFYYRSLNRMTLLDLQDYCVSAGFDILEFIPWHFKYDLGSLNQEVLSQIKTYYPKVTVSDLLSRSVWILLNKIS